MRFRRGRLVIHSCWGVDLLCRSPRDLLRERVVAFVEAVIHGELLRPVSACRYPLSCSFVGRHLAGPGVTVIMAVDGTGGGAASRVIELSAVHPFAALLTQAA